MGDYCAILLRAGAVSRVIIFRESGERDADGQPKTKDEFEAWGMLDASDSYLAEMADALEFARDDAAANEVEIFTYYNDKQVLTVFNTGSLNKFINALTKARQKIG